MGTVEKEQDVIKIFLVDGTCKGFLVTSSMTVNALKYLVAQKTNVDKSDWSNFGVFMATREKIVGPLVDKPFDVHKKWGRHSGFDLRFVFKRVDEQYPAEPDPIETIEIDTPAAGVEAPLSMSPTSPNRDSPLTSKTMFGSSAGSPSIFRRKITTTPQLTTTPDPTISYNTAQEASKVQSDPTQNDLGYDYNLEMSSPAYDLTYMRPNASSEDLYAHIGADQETGLKSPNDEFYGHLAQQNGTMELQPDMPPLEHPNVGLPESDAANDIYYGNLDHQNGSWPTDLQNSDLPPMDAPQMPTVGALSNTPKGVVSPGVSRTTSAQVSMRVPSSPAPKAPVRAQSTQVALNSPSTSPRVGGTVPKRPPPPSTLRKSGKTSIKIITGNTQTATSNNTTSADPTTVAPSSPKTLPKMSPKTNPKTTGSPKSGHFKMPPPATQRPVSAQIAIPTKTTPTTVVQSGSPKRHQAQQRLHKTEDATKSRHEQHKQIVISWINSQLACRGISIRNLTNDIQDGVALIKLLEVLSEKKLEKYYGVPKMMMQKLDNLGHFLGFLRVLGIRIDGVSAEDLYVGNENLTLAILLVVLRKYGATVPKPARRPSRSSVSGTAPRKTSTSNTTPNDSPVRKNSRSGSTSGNTTPTAASPKRKPSGTTSSPNLGSPARKTSGASSNSTTPTGTPVRKTSKTNGTPTFTMPPPARIKSGMPKTAPKRPGTPQLPRKSADTAPKKSLPIPAAVKVDSPVKPDVKPIEVQQPVIDQVKQVEVSVPDKIEGQAPVLQVAGSPTVTMGTTLLTTNRPMEDVMANLNNAVSDVDKILNELNLGSSQTDVLDQMGNSQTDVLDQLGGSHQTDALDQLESPKAPEDPLIDYNNTDYYDQYMGTTFDTKFGDTIMLGGSNNNNVTQDSYYDLSLKSSTDSLSPRSIMEQTAENKFQSGSFVRSLPQGIKSPTTAERVEPAGLSPRNSPRTVIGQRGSLSLNSSPNETSTGAIPIPNKPNLVSDAVIGSPSSGRFRNSPKPGSTKLPPHKMLMMHAQTSKYMSGGRSSGTLDSLKAVSAPTLGVGSNSNTSSPVTSPTSHRKSSIFDESGNVYTEVIKLDDLTDVKDDVDPRFELDLTVNAGNKQKNSAFRDPNKTAFDLTSEIDDIDSLMENVMMTLGPSNNNVEINWD